MDAVRQIGSPSSPSAGLLDAARGAFTRALRAAALTGAAIALGGAVLVLLLLRNAQTDTETMGRPRHGLAVPSPGTEGS